MKNKLLFLLLLFLFLADIIYSFVQHYHMPLDGDLAPVVVPSFWHKKVLADPLGLNVLIKNESYSGPNRFFAHWSMVQYFNHVPIALQSIFSPITSAYVATAITKTTVQVLIIWLLTAFITGSNTILNKDNLLVALLITPLFQTLGYAGQMSIIDPSITYTFFYALSLLWLLLFFLPFFKQVYHQQEIKFSIPFILFLLLLIPITTLNGPLPPPVILIVCPLTILYHWNLNYKNSSQIGPINKGMEAFKNLPIALSTFFTIIVVCSLYSFYIGMNNSENFNNSIPIIERYQRLPFGLYLMFTTKLGLAALTLMIIINSILIKRLNNSEGKKIIQILLWICVFSFIYILLLPLGGYREYRPYIVRRDRLMPVILCMFFIYGLSTYYLLKNRSSLKYPNFYIILILIHTFIFTNADELDLNYNSCEKQGLETIANSKDTIVEIHSDCSILGWGKITEPEHSAVNCKLLERWRIIKEPKLYYQK